MTEPVRLVTLTALLLATTACVDTPRMAEPEIESSHVAISSFPASPPAKLDVLVFVDDTVAMAPYRDELSRMPAQLGATIDAVAKGWRNVRIAVTSNDAKLRPVADSQSRYLVDSRDNDYSHDTNYAGSIDDALAALLDVGADNAGPSQPLEAVRRALETNTEFLRDDASLAIITITAADDASPWPVADYVHWLDSFEGGWRRRVVTAAIYPQPSSRLDEYFHAIRIGGRVIELDGGDYLEAFDVLQLPQWSSHGGPCVEGRIIEPESGDYNCAMSVWLDNELRSLPQCASPSPIVDRIDQPFSREPGRACWYITHDNMNCTYGDRLTYRFSGYSLDRHPAFRFECVTR